MLVSVAQQSESAIRIHMSPYPLPLASPSHPPYRTPLGHCKAPSRSPCAVLLLPTSQLFFTFHTVYMSMLLSLCPTFDLPPHVLKSILYVCLFIPALPLGSSVPFFFFFRFHIYALAYGISFSRSDLLPSVWQTLGPSISLQITQFRIFLWLSNIPLYICATLLYPFICRWTLRLLPCPGYCK